MNEQVPVGKVLRQPVQGESLRRLTTHSGPTASEAATHSLEQQRSQLRSLFADELAQLERQAQEAGLIAARQQAQAESEKTLLELKQQLQKEQLRLRTELEQQQKSLAAVSEALKAKTDQALASLEPVVARLALTAVITMLGQKRTSRALVAELAQQAVEHYRLVGPVHIRIAASDLASLQALETDQAILALFQSDDDLEPGSCLIEHASGQLDAGLQTQLSALKQALLETNDGESDVAGA